MTLALVSLLLASCGEGEVQRDGAGNKRDPRPETLEWADGTGDMWAAKFGEDGGFVPGEPRPTVTNGDIRRVAVTHRPESLVIKVQYQDLEPAHLNFTVPLRAFVRSDVGLESELTLTWDEIAQESSVGIVNENSAIDCRAASGILDFEGKSATVRVSRSCLGLPRWVQVYVESEISQSENFEAEPAHVDSAMDAGFPNATRQDGTLIKHALSKRVYAHTPASPSGRGVTTLVLSDPRGDVVRVGGEADDFSEATPAPKYKDGDILSSTIEHTPTQLRIRVEFARIVPDSRVANYRLGAELKTDRGTWLLEDDMAGPAAEPRPILHVGEVPVTCSVDRSIDYADRTSTLSIPRTCLGGDPAWVQTSLVLVTWQPRDFTTIDDARTAGYDASTTFSRRVFKP